MNKVKQETFSNFHYEMIKSIDNRCADVKCTYTYKGKTLTHYFSYAKSGNKPSSYYISKAKADMNQIVNDKSPKTVAKQDLNGKKATFFRRHKKPILIATTAVLVAGVATAATLVALKYLNKTDPEAVTEAEIDEHLKFPSGELTIVEDEEITNKILSDAVATIETDEENGNKYFDPTEIHNAGNLTTYTEKRMGSYKARAADPDYGGRVADRVEEKLKKSDAIYNVSVNSYDLFGNVRYNDTTEFNTVNSFKTKRLNSGYRKTDLTKDPLCSYAHIVNTYDEVIENVGVKSVYVSDNYITHKENKDKKEILFENGKTTVDGIETRDLASVIGVDTSASVVSYDDCEKAMAEEILREFVVAGDLNNFIAEKQYVTSNFYQKNDNEYYAIAFEPSPYIQYIDSVFYPDTGVPGYVQPLYIWHFVKDSRFAKGGNDGWILESFARDESLYTNYNDRYEKLANKICVNKNKGFVEFTYGEKESAAEIVKNLEIPVRADGSTLNDNEIQAPQIPASWIQGTLTTPEGEESKSTSINIFDITIPYRASTGKEGYMAVSDGAIYVPKDEDELDDEDGITFKIKLGSVYFDEEYQVDLSKLDVEKKYAKYYKVDTSKNIVTFEDDGKGLYYTISLIYENKSLSVSAPKKEEKLADNSILKPKIELVPLI